MFKVRIGKLGDCVRPNTFVYISARPRRLQGERGFVGAGAIGKRDDRPAATQPNCGGPVVVLMRTNLLVRSIDWLFREDWSRGSDLNQRHLYPKKWFDTREIVGDRPNLFYVLPSLPREPFDSANGRRRFGRPFS